MKSFYSILVALAALFLFNYKAYSQADTSCSGAISFGAAPTCLQNQELSGTHRWYSFTPASNRIKFNLKNIKTDSTRGHIHTLALYSSCMSLALDSVNLATDTSTYLKLTDTNLTAGNTYYLLLSRTSVSCPGCVSTDTAIYSVCSRLDNVETTSSGFTMLIDTVGCGIHYVTSTIQMNQRTEAFTHIGLAQPATFPTPVVPPGANILHAYLWFTAVTGKKFNSGIVHGTFTADSTHNYPISPIALALDSGNATCWEFLGFTTTISYFTDVTAYVKATPGGAYILSGFPVSIANTDTAFDIDGATLMIVYKTCDYVPARLMISQGLSILKGIGTITNPVSTSCRSPLTILPGSNAFDIISDIQDNLAFTTFGSSANETIDPVNTKDMYSLTMFPSTSITGGPGYTWMADNAGQDDCYDLTVCGLYVQGQPQCGLHGCDTLKVKVNPSKLCASTFPITVTASATGGEPAYTYLWSPSGGTDSIAVLSAGTYTVTVTDAGGCSVTATTTLSQTPLILGLLSQTVCPGGCVTLSEPPASNQIDVWSPNFHLSCDTCFSTTACPTVTTIYTVTGIDTIGGCTASTFVRVTVAPASPVTVTPSNPSICIGDSVLLTASGSALYTYTWRLSTGLSCTNCTSPYAKPIVTTTYTVVGASSNGCKDSTTVMVTVNPLPPPPVLGNQTICFGSSAEVGDSLSLPPHIWNYTQTWTASSGTFSCNTCGLTFYIPTGPGIDTITETKTDIRTGCTAKYKIIIKVNALPAISISGPTLTCTAGSSRYCPTVTGGSGHYIYSWSVTGGATSTAPCPHGIHVIWADTAIGGIAVLNVSDSLTGCMSTDTVFVRGCCIPNTSDPFTMKNDTLSTLKLPYPHGITKVGNTFYIHSIGILNIDGLIIVDRDLVIRKSAIFCGTNAKFLVTGGHCMTVDTSHIYACADMWDGIYLNATPGIPDTLIVKNSVIEDAQNAVVSLDGAPYFINSSILNKNFVGIKVEPYAGLFSGTFTNSYITCDSLNDFVHNQPPATNHILPPGLYPNDTLVSLKAPHAGFRSYIGIDIGTVLNIKVGAVNNNTYQDLDYGIYSHNSNLTVNYDHFLNMDSIPIIKHIKANTNYPCGILALGGVSGFSPFTLRVGISSPCTFNACKYGIWARDSINAFIEKNIITGSTAFGAILKSEGVNIMDNQARTLHVKKNNISNYYIGINAYRNINSHITIDSNFIVGIAATWHTSYGIDVNEFPTPLRATHYIIDSNTIQHFSSGIYSIDLDSALIDHNLITMSGSGLLGFNNGIYASGSVSSRIINNTLSYITATVAYGIRLDHGKSNRITCNTINFTGAAIGSEIAFWGSQTPNTFVDLNSLNMHTGVGDTGIHLLMTTSNIGHQGGDSMATANCWSIFSGAPPIATFVDNLSNVGSPVPTQFFVNPSAAAIGTVCEYPALNMNKKTGLGQIIPFNAANPADTNRCPSRTHAPLDNVLDSVSAMGIVNDSLQFPTFNNTSMWLDKNTLFYYLTELDSSLTVYPSIKRFRDSALITNMGIIKRIDKLLSDTMGVSFDDIIKANRLNRSMVSPNQAEKTYQKVYDVMIDMFINAANIPDSAQQVLLKAIAPLCPAEYGTGVYVARAMLSQVDTNHYYTTCIGRDDDHEAIKAGKKEIANIPPVVKVYPNPANTLLNVQVNLQASEVARICLYNSMGQLIQCEQLQNSLTTLPINNLAAGIYFYRVLDENGNLLKADKQMIIH